MRHDGAVTAPAAPSAGDPLYEGFPDGFFDRRTRRPTTTSTACTRLVTHIDDGAIAAVGALYDELGIDGTVLDLMSSWVSHFRTPPAHLTVLGMNHDELDANPAASERVVHDLNADPALPFADGAFDAVGVLRVGRLPRAPDRGVPRGPPRAPARRTVRVHVLQPAVPHQGDPRLARHRRSGRTAPSSPSTSDAPAAGPSRWPSSGPHSTSRRSALRRVRRGAPSRGSVRRGRAGRGEAGGQALGRGLEQRNAVGIPRRRCSPRLTNRRPAGR